MARPRKLSQTAVRAIFRSTDTAAEIAPRYRVSTALVSQIRQRRRYEDVTRSLKAPKGIPGRGRRRYEESRRRPQRDTIELNWLVDAVVDQLMRRLLRPSR